MNPRRPAPFAIYVILSLALSVCLHAGAGRGTHQLILPICCNCAGHGISTSLSVELDGSVLKCGDRILRYDEAKDYLNAMLKLKNRSALWVFPREDTTFGQVVDALDLLKKTDATHVNVWWWKFRDDQNAPED